MNTRPTIYLCRHGDTAWSGERRFAGRTDIPLTPEGEQAAVLLGKRLQQLRFDRVLVSPLARARRTAELAAPHISKVSVDPRLIEVFFGEYEGKTRQEIAAFRPGWTYVRDGNPGGESIEDVGVRIDSLLAELLPVKTPDGKPGHVLIFAHAVVLRVMASRWVGQPASFAQHLSLSPASLSILTYDPVDDAPSIASWNDRSHLPNALTFA